jgi:hypothetical protein
MMQTSPMCALALRYDIHLKTMIYYDKKLTKIEMFEHDEFSDYEMQNIC